MKDFFEFLDSNSINPNGLMLLHNFDKIQKKEFKSKFINLQHELNKLQLQGLIIKKIDGTYDLSVTAAQILKEAKRYFKLGEKLKSPVDDEDFSTKIAEFNNLFPKGRKENATISYRSNPKELTERFKWFFKTYPEYTWDDVMAATKFYVSSFEESNDFTYMQVSKYFVYKQDKSKVIVSNLADMCYNFKNNNMEQQNSGYKYWG